jgi:hypothetical protein
MKKVAILLAGLLASTTVTNAADLSPACNLVGPSQLLTIDNNSKLTDTVVQMMTEAVNVAESPKWIDNQRPAYVWASEAKVACGKAYGYLRTNHRDEQYLNKCECFHQRMTQYMY